MSLYRSAVFTVKGLLEFTKAGFERAKIGFNDDEMSVSCEGRVFLVTGANSGIGHAIASEISRRGGTLHTVCRDPKKSSAAATILRNLNPSCTIIEHIVDLSLPREACAFTKRFNRIFGKLDVLVNNAGVLLNERTKTEDNLEQSFATNVLGTYICTTGLLPSLEKSTDPRVIIVSSGGMYNAKLHLDDLQSENGFFDGSSSYAQHKRQQVIMMEQMALKHPQIFFCSMHPGWCETPGVEKSLPTFHKLMKSMLRSADDGADTVIWLATLARNHICLENGGFYFDRQITSKHLPLAWTRSAPEEDAQLMSLLADLTMKICDKIPETALPSL